ncbi:GTP-binding protein [Candidatus Formimonas warabiya]|uniref:Cobalamin biosynthesis protein P47K n=1 Tax=Formimonas warabiya TaxID=1761012 RepID=A0A3G1KQJ3_FORW1|nr:GTP-binding protein [Candidatus Formimonas warabiya]ATW24742.1 cobalamin biosynthesis protein P47K [Candidatus Formimonas warabiya]
MNVILTGGFLGSGKTTLIRQLAEYQILKGQQVVIIENEVGDVGIDNQFLSLEGFQVKEIVGGCVCCTLTGELTLAVNKITAEYHPDWLIIEMTGLAKPSSVLDSLKKYGQGIGHLFTVIVVDAGRWGELMEIMPELITMQLVEADLVIANKIDELGDGDGLEQVITGIKSVNTGAEVMALSALGGIQEHCLKELCAHAICDQPLCPAKI